MEEDDLGPDDDNDGSVQGHDVCKDVLGPNVVMVDDDSIYYLNLSIQYWQPIVGMVARCVLLHPDTIGDQIIGNGPVDGGRPGLSNGQACGRNICEH